MRRSRRHTVRRSRPRRPSRTSSTGRTRPKPSRPRSSRAVRRRSGGRGLRRKGRRGSARCRQARKTLIRQRIAVHKIRPDGRGSEEIRAIDIEVSVTPRTHGSALFTRGQTQALSSVALGTTREEMRLDTLGLETSKRYFHHCSFPPFSVGEAGRLGGPKHRTTSATGRSLNALVPMIPSQEDFPYTIRVVSEVPQDPTVRVRWPVSAAHH